MIPIDHTQRCRCAAPIPSGTRYFRREKCVRCGLFLVYGAERRMLMEAELVAIEAERTFSSAAELTRKDLADLLRRTLRSKPTLSQRALRNVVSEHGRWPHSESDFVREVRRVRVEMGIITRQGARPEAPRGWAA